jgi:hypothetical protein
MGKTLDMRKCPQCGLARRADKLTRKHGPEAVLTFETRGCEALGLRHFGDGRMDRFADGIGALGFTEYATLDLMQERRRAKYPPPPPPPPPV